MADPAERMRATRDRRRSSGLRALRLVLPDARSSVVRRRVATAAASLARDDERDAMDWVEAVSELDEDEDTSLTAYTIAKAATIAANPTAIKTT